MSLKYELTRIERANKANPQREQMLLEVCERYMPDESQSALAFICIVKWIDKTWREFAKGHRLNADLFKQWVIENQEDAKALLKW